MAHHIPPPKIALPQKDYVERAGHKPAILWFTGLSAAGKTTLATKLGQELFKRGCQTVVLDGDDIRHGLCKDLGFSASDRSENIRRVAEMGKLFFLRGNIVISTFIAPFAKDRKLARELFPEGSFFEVHVDCSLEECIRRDPKGLYKKALAHEIQDFTGISSPYEAPEKPEFRIASDQLGISESLTFLIDGLEQMNIIPISEKKIMEPLFFKGHRLDCVYGNLSNSVRDEILNFWTSYGSIPSSGEARRRTKEVVFTIRNRQHELIGVNTVYLHHLIKEKSLYYMYRSFIRPQNRGDFNLTRFAFWETKNYLKEIPLDGEKAKGIALVSENPKLMRKAVLGIFEKGPMQLYGKTPQGFDLWFVNFDIPSLRIK